MGDVVAVGAEVGVGARDGVAPGAEAGVEAGDRVAVKVSSDTGVEPNAVVGGRASVEDEQPDAINDSPRIDRNATTPFMRYSNPSNIVLVLNRD